jgi:hypothetical protein
MQETVGVRMDLLVALNAVSVEAHVVGCLYEDLYEMREYEGCL